ncbi:hypothetical protein [Actinokineospora enzanensis]|uniref:hypothetical protein n=1 Tax=Actinokineospora enzanensis TaxID=155975 RepID=UPI0003A8797E|nr:hypothetical protein [Actinokineospora enzanensis]
MISGLSGVAAPRVRSPLLDLVRLTPVLRHGVGTLAVEVLATAADTPHLTGVIGFSGLSICPLSPVLTRPLGVGCPPDELADVLRAVTARIALVSLTLGAGPADRLRAALDDAAARDVLVIAAGGNRALRHPWVVPVLSCTPAGRPSWFVDLDQAAESRGLLAPGEDVPGPSGTTSGNGVAAAVVAGTAALLWSLFPTARAADVRSALMIGATSTRRLCPPLLDAQRAHEHLAHHAG